MVKKLLLLFVALVALRMASRAAARNAQAASLLWMLACATANLGANTAKSRSTEDRLNNLIPVVFPNTGGTINGSVTVTGTHAANQVLAGGASSSASVAGTSAHFTGNAQVDGTHGAGQVLVNGASSSAAIAANGDAHMTGVVQGDGGLSTGGNVSAGGGVTANQVIIGGASTTAALGAPSAHISALAVNSLNGGSLPLGAVSTVSGSATTAQLAAAINGLISRLGSVGIIP